MRLTYFIVLFLTLPFTAVPGFSQTKPNALDERLGRADALQDKGALRESREIYESVAKSIGTGVASAQLGHALNGLSNVAAAQGSYEQAVEFARQADAVYQKLGDARGRAFALNSMGISEGELGRYAAAQVTFRQALGLTRSTGDVETTVRTLSNLGNAYYFPGDYLEALRSYEEAEQILERKSGERWAASWREIIYINEATLYQRLGRYQRALEIYRRVGSDSKNLTAGDRAHLVGH